MEKRIQIIDFTQDNETINLFGVKQLSFSQNKVRLIFYFLTFLIVSISVFYFELAFNISNNPVFFSISLIKSIAALFSLIILFEISLILLKFDNSVFFYYIFAIILIIFGDFCNYLAFYLLNSNEVFYNNLAEVVFLISHISLICIPVVFIFFISEYTGHETSFFVFFLPLLFLSVNISLIINGSFPTIGEVEIFKSDEFFRYFVIDPPGSFLTVIAIATFGIIALYALRTFEIEYNLDEGKLFKENNLLKLGFLYFFLVLPIIKVIFVRITIISYIGFVLDIIFFVILVQFGLILFFSIFRKIKSPMALKSFPVHSLIIMTLKGDPIYQWNFKDSKEKNFEIEEHDFIGGSIFTINSSMQEFNKISEDVNLITFEEKFIITNFIEDIGFYLISDLNLPILRKALIKFSFNLYNNYIEVANNCYLINSLIEVEQLIHRTF